MFDSYEKVRLYLIFNATTLMDVVGNGKTFARRDHAHTNLVRRRSDNIKKKAPHLTIVKSSGGQ